MNKENEPLTSIGELRQRAEEAIQELPVETDNLSPEMVKRLLHELRVHQIELEMQNEELRLAQIEIETSRDNYADLYDFAPVSYFTINEKGLILEANLTGAALLDVERKNLIHTPFSHYVAKDDHDKYYLYKKNLLEMNNRRSCEIKMAKRDGTLFYALLESAPFKNSEDKIIYWQMAVSDITERKSLEQEREQLLKELQTAFDKVKLLSGFIPICASCKKIRNDQGYWEQVEVYIREHSEAEFSHGFCPECLQKLYPNLI